MTSPAAPSTKVGSRIATRKSALWAAVGLAGAAIWWLAAAQPPGGGAPGFGCPVRHLLGVACPGCGMTRALCFLARGDWRAAMAFHPLAPLIVAEAALLWIVWGLVVRGSVRAPRRREMNFLLIANVILLLGVWLWRFLHHSLPAA